MKKLLLLTIILSSCLTEKKSVKQLALIQNKFPTLIAQNCADKFPIKESVEIREVITYDTIKSVDTLIKDSIINNEVIRFVYLPGKTITKTIKKDSIIRLENTAKLFVLESKLKASNEALIVANHKLKTLRTILYIMFVFSVVLVMLKKLIW
jgi:hypothetical protein